MKRLFIVVAMLAVGVIAQAQVELIGIELGSTYDSDSSIVIKTTVGGLNGFIFISTTSDSKISGMLFVPSGDGESPVIISKSDVSRFMLGLENKYNIEFKSYELDNGGFNSMAFNDGVSFICNYSPYKIGTFSVNFVFEMKNMELDKAKKKEKLESINNDF